MGIIDSNRNVIDKKIIDELRAANEKQERQALQTRDMFLNAI